MKEYSEFRIFLLILASTCFGDRFGIFFLILKNWPLKNSPYWKIDFVILFVIVGRDKFNVYSRYSKPIIYFYFFIKFKFFGHISDRLKP